MTINRREMLGLLGAAALNAADWDSGSVDHILPAANHNRILVKVSFKQPLSAPPRLSAGARSAQGLRGDSHGTYWSFGLDNLKPATTHTLRLLDARGKPLCQEWPLKTFPDPSANISRFRLMIYTCAGGHPELPEHDSPRIAFLPLAQRQAMFENGLRFQPDAAVAIGDQVYWDLRVGWAAERLGKSKFALSRVGVFDRSLPVFGTDNERKLKLAVHPQIASLYGARFRSTPVFFVQDDHDYFENDEAHPHIVTFPPDPFMLRMARATQRLFYPEFLPDPNRPLGLQEPGAANLSESFGTLRYGNLAELLIYDCRRFTSLAGPAATLIPEEAEKWIMQRMASRDTAHLVNVPSLPLAWSAGKWGDWYPDVLQDNGKLGLGKPKYFWQEGWRTQHDRLLAAASAMNRIPLFLCGDMHAHAHGRIFQTGKADLRRNPVETLLTGPISTGRNMWPSSARGTPPLASLTLELEQPLPPVERNGFSIVDFTPDHIEIRSFAWKQGEPEDGLRGMQPFRTVRLQRRG
ncbi:MAG: hypothetical protein FJW20_05300 [Acidimicrobiia bacterium]|nr:hypothetical protein [Acidimicrobiia bacterium]